MQTFGIGQCREIGIIKNAIKDAIKDAILDGIITSDYEEAFRFMLEKEIEIGLKAESSD